MIFKRINIYYFNITFFGKFFLTLKSLLKRYKKTIEKMANNP